MLGTATSLESVGISYLCAKRNNASTLSATSARGELSSTCRDYKLWTMEKPQNKVIEGLRILIQHDLKINPFLHGFVGGNTGSPSPSEGTVSSMSLNIPICCASSQGTLTTFVRWASVMRSITRSRGLSSDCTKLTVNFYPSSLEPNRFAPLTRRSFEIRKRHKW